MAWADVPSINNATNDGGVFSVVWIRINRIIVLSAATCRGKIRVVAGALAARPATKHIHARMSAFATGSASAYIPHSGVTCGVHRLAVCV